MALSKDQKQAQVKELTEKMGSASSIILAHYIGLSVGEVSELRTKLREGEAEMKVAKKTLMKIATKEAGLPEFKEETMEGPVSMIFSFGDPLSGAQVAFKFGKDHENVQILGGLYDGKVLTKEEALDLAKMPSRDVLLATFVGMLRSPLTNFAGICSSPLSGFARALQELAEKGGVNPETEAPAKDVKAEAPADEAPAENAEEKEPVSAEATKGKPASAEATDGKPASAEATDGKPASAEATDGKPASAEATKGKPASAEATDGKEEKAETPAKESDSSEPAEEESSDSEKTES